jgi:uncharacterized protein
MVLPTLSRIEIFPVKSLDGVTLHDVTVLPSGALKGDRQYALKDAKGRFVNGKNNTLVHRLRTTFSEDLTTITLRCQGLEESATFSLVGDRSAPRVRMPLETWLSDYFSQPVTVQENTTTGFPDDLSAVGPTVISTATLAAVAQWFPEVDLAEIRRRFRTNLEIDRTPAFWEDQLYGEPNHSRRFEVGAVTLLGINPCQRCVVPTRNSLTGDRSAPRVRHFQQQFVQFRQAQLPNWASRERFNHFYKLAVNTCLAPDSQSFQLKIDDEIKILPEKDLQHF